MSICQTKLLKNRRGVLKLDSKDVLSKEDGFLRNWDELQLTINKLEAQKGELQETTTDSNQHVTEFQETNADLEMEQEIVMLMNDLSTPPPNIAISYHQNEDEMPH